jgi:ribonuclease VapC
LSLFIDASALVAIIVNEAEREHFIDRISAEKVPLWSAMSCWETVTAVRKAEGVTIEVARAVVRNTAEALSLRFVSIGELELAMALDAHQAYGRSSGHPAKLNFGDCFAYACAKTNNASLLYKGNDFAKTDLA